MTSPLGGGGVLVKVSSCGQVLLWTCGQCQHSPSTAALPTSRRVVCRTPHVQTDLVLWPGRTLAQPPANLPSAVTLARLPTARPLAPARKDRPVPSPSPQLMFILSSCPPYSPPPLPFCPCSICPFSLRTLTSIPVTRLGACHRMVNLYLVPVSRAHTYIWCLSLEYVLISFPKQRKCIISCLLQMG